MQVIKDIFWKSLEDTIKAGSKEEQEFFEEIKHILKMAFDGGYEAGKLEAQNEIKAFKGLTNGN